MKHSGLSWLWMIAFVVSITTPYPLLAEPLAELHHFVDFSQFDLVFSKVAGYDVISMDDAGIMSELGEPMLPVKSFGIALPLGTKAVKIEVKSLSVFDIPGEFNVLPGQPPLPTNTSAQISEKPNQAIYLSKAPYPPILATLEQQSNMAGQPIVWVNVSPLQYKPREKRLILHNVIELTVYYTTNRVSEDKSQERYFKFTELQRSLYEEMIKGMVVNPGQVHVNPMKTVPSLFLPAGDYDHVVITSSAYASYFQPLVEWHTKKGLKDTVVTTEYIYANYPGPGDTLQIRQFVIDANTNWGTMYFLMGGEDNIVPFDWRYYTGEQPGQITPSDQYYSDYDNDWVHEVYVGRVPVDNSTQINTFVNKVLKYEKNPPLTNYPLDVLLIAMDLDDSSPSEPFVEQIAGYLPGYFHKNKVYDSHGGNHLDSTLYYLNAGQNLVEHSDHSNQTYMGTGSFHHNWGFENGNVDNLINNGKTCAIVSTGCEPNAMDFEDCIAEHFVIYNPDQAGVAFVGDTRHGWYYVGNAGGLTGEINRRWWDAVFNRNQRDHGKALVDCKHQFAQGSDATKRHCEWTFNLQGDPAMPIWTNTPVTMKVTHNYSVRAQAGNFTVTVKENDGTTPIDSALVCCWVKGQVPGMYVTAYTNASGVTTLSVSPNSPGDTMSVTVTKHNHLPYEGFALVTAASGPYVIAGSRFVIADGGDGIVNPGETIDFGIWAINTGFSAASGVYGLLSESDPYVSINSAKDSCWYGNIASVDSVLSAARYNFTVANNCPNGYKIQFNVAFTDNIASTWISHPEVTVSAPFITYQRKSVVNGQWDNGILDPAETANLIITIKNEGSTSASNVTSTLIENSSYIIINDGSGSFGTINPGDSANNASDPYTITASSATPFGTPIDFSVAIASGVYRDTLDFTLVVGQFPPSDTGYYYCYYSGSPYSQAPVFAWFAIDTTQTTHPGVSLNLNNNQTVRVALPFTFKYYGINYNRISISSNGWIALDSTMSTDQSNTSIPNVDGPPRMVAGLWDYLHPGIVGAPGDIYHYYDATNHRFVVEYFRVAHYPSGNPETFEIILYDPLYYPTPTGDGEIVVQYLTAIAQPNSNTIGIENVTQTIGIEYNFNGVYDSLARPITNQFALRYTTYGPSPGVSEQEGFSVLPMQTRLSKLYPNPFNHGINIQYQVAQTGVVALRVYDVSGRLVRNLRDGVCVPGYYTITWNGTDNIGRKLAAGVYFVSFMAKNEKDTNSYNKVEKTVMLR